MAEILFCPVCGCSSKQNKNHLVCGKCYKNFVDEAAKLLAKGKAITLPEWVEVKIREKLPLLQKELEEKRESYTKLQEEVSQSAFEKIREALGAKKSVPREVFKRALTEKKKELWREKRGDRLCREFRTLEAKVNFLTTLLKELEEKAKKGNPNEKPLLERPECESEEIKNNDQKKEEEAPIEENV